MYIPHIADKLIKQETEMKKLLILLICILTVSLCVPMSSASDSTGTYTVTSDVAYIYSEATEISSKQGEITKGTYVTVTEVAGPYGKAFFPSIGAYGWVNLYSLTLCEGENGKTDITGLKLTFAGKTEYVQGEEEFDQTGLTVYAVHKPAGQTAYKEKITGYTVYVDSLKNLGEKTVTVTYSPAGTNTLLSSSFKITVIPVPVSSVTIVSLPTKTAYKEHEEFDITGLKLKITYNDGRSAETYTAAKIKSNPDFTLSVAPGTVLEPGTKTVSVKYKYDGITASFKITVSKRVLTELTVKTQPTTLVTYSKTEQPDISGLVLHAVYDNGETEDVDASKCTVSCTPSSFILGSGNAVTVSYGGKSVKLYYTLAKNTVKGLLIKTPKVLLFRAGFDIDLSSTVIYKEYSDGTLVRMKNYTVSKVDKTLMGTQNIVVTCGSYSEVFSIYITPYYQRGDIDGSGDVTVTDARLVLRSILGYVKLGGITFNAADADFSGTVDVFDARLILRDALGKENFINDSKVTLP